MSELGEGLELDAVDQRVLGSLLEKQRTVPASYPLTLNSLRTACNQSNSRDPVSDYDEPTLQAAVKSLKERGLLRIVWADRGPRTLKYHQVLDERLSLQPDEGLVRKKSAAHRHDLGRAVEAREDFHFGAIAPARFDTDT